jgi:hypothetical protein
MWPLKTVLYFALFWAACLLALFNPIWGVINYLMVYQINPMKTWWGTPLVALGMRFSMLAIVFTVLGFVFGRRHVPQIRPTFSLWEVGLLAIVAAAALSLVIGDTASPRSGYAFEKLWKMLLFVFILGRLATTRKNFKLVLWAFVAGSLYVGHEGYTAPRAAFWLGRLEAIGGPDFHSTSGTAAHLSAMLPLIGTAFLISDKWKWRAFAAVSGAFAVNTIILCRTRSAFVGLACGAAAAVLTAPRVKRFRIHLLLVTAAVLAFSLTDQYFWVRMGTLTDRDTLAKDAAAVSRADIWVVSLRIIADHPQGIGVGNFPSVIGSYDPRYHKRSSHNTLVVCLTELGIHGGVVFILMAAGSLRLLYRAAKLADDTVNPIETKMLIYGLLVALVTYFVTGLGTERFYCESFWWILVLPLCLYRVVIREATANVEAPALVRARYEDEGLRYYAPIGTWAAMITR